MELVVKICVRFEELIGWDSQNKGRFHSPEPIHRRMDIDEGCRETLDKNAGVHAKQRSSKVNHTLIALTAPFE
jgi:hypothetical protein